MYSLGYTLATINEREIILYDSTMPHNEGVFLPLPSKILDDGLLT
jgi:hypothetical protein